MTRNSSFGSSPCFYASIGISVFAMTALHGFADTPKLHDGRLELTLFAEHPQIVTPIGLVVDSRDRVFVIESHTHNPPPDYEGPKTDRIKMLVDTDGDGTADSITVFAEGFDAAMNLAFGPDGTLYVVCARSVYALPDLDRDGRCDGKRSVLELMTEERYPHNCWLSITFGPDGWLYVGRGNTGSRAYQIVGSDGSRVQGYGDGGNIVRCRPDGTRLHEVATGFWNPFDIKFDQTERLLCVDNDPDARGPNRLVHVVMGGNYGYQSLYGGSGNHPYQAWDGELPGTLPIASGTGEAPCGILDARRTSFATDLKQSYLVTVWNENTIELHEDRHWGASIQAKRRVLVSGDANFRPVALDVDSNGHVLFSDWVKVDYPNHGQGRIWRLACRTAARTVPLGKQLPSDKERLLRTMLSADSQPLEEAQILTAIDHGDPFLHHAASMALTHPDYNDRLLQLANHREPQVRLAVLLAAKRSAASHSIPLATQFLDDSDRRVQRAALQWVGEARLVTLRDRIDGMLRSPNIDADLFHTYLATVRCLDVESTRAYKSQQSSRSSHTYAELPKGFARQLAGDRSLPSSVRALAVSQIGASEDDLPLLLELLDSGDVPMKMAALQKLAQRQVDQEADRMRCVEMVLSVAKNSRQLSTVRCEALLTLASWSSSPAADILNMVTDASADVALEAARTLRHLELDDAQRQTLQHLLPSVPKNVRQQILFCLRQADEERPRSIDEWEQWLLEGGGNPRLGRRAFFSLHASCSRCHTVNGTGGILGPDLSHVAASKQRAQLVRAVLQPSLEFPPQYQAWQVLTADGRVQSGLQLDHKAKGAIEMIATTGEKVRFEAEEIEEYLASPQSIMPSGLEAAMTAYELRDLIAFLETLR